jgi:hypothetical protein
VTSMGLFSPHHISSRKQIAIKCIKDNVLVLPNREYRLILETSSVNFELKSEAEQDVIIDAFQTFLNALPSPIQILVRVREIDIDTYTQDIERAKASEPEEIYKEQLTSYCQFVKELVSGNSILSRRFYLVIPYHRDEKYEDWGVVKEHLNLNKDIIVKGLERMQMKANVLSSLEIINLFYSFYNPESVKTQAITKETLSTLLRHNYV